MTTQTTGCKNPYRWTTRIAIAGFGFLAVIAAFAAVVRILNVPVAGVQPEAFVLTAMMTSPITVGGVLVAIGISALVERRSKAKNRL